MTEPTILAFDTSGPHVAAALLRGGQIVAQAWEEMARGQVEHLFPVLDVLLAEAGLGWRDLGAVAVGVGPGNFTGIRISVSAARGLALALDIPAVGVSSFEVMRGPQSRAMTGAQTVALPGTRGTVYEQEFLDGLASGAPVQRQTATADGETGASGLTGDDFAPTLARIAAAKLAAGDTIGRPVPLYVRPADAAPPRDAPPRILDA